MVMVKGWRTPLFVRKFTCCGAAMVPVTAVTLLCGSVNEARAQQARAPEAAPVPAVTTTDLLPPIPETSPQTAAPAKPSVTAYSSFDFSYVFNTFPGREYKATSYQETAGLSITLNPTVTLGAGATFSQSYSRLLYLENGRSRTDGPGGFVSASVNVGTAEFRNPAHESSSRNPSVRNRAEPPHQLPSSRPSLRMPPCDTVPDP